MLRCVLLVGLVALLSASAQGQQLDQLFRGSSFSAMLNDQLGSTVIGILHPLCKHDTTSLDSQSGNLFRFRTKYKFVGVKHELQWALKLDQTGLPVDVTFLDDTNPVKTGNLANRLKSDLAPVIRRYLERVK